MFLSLFKSYLEKKGQINQNQWNDETCAFIDCLSAFTICLVTAALLVPKHLQQN